MDVDEGGAPIRNPKAESYVPKLPAIGVKMSKGRRSEIERWADFLEQFLPWIALFDDRIQRSFIGQLPQRSPSSSLRLIRGRVCDLLELALEAVAAEFPARS